MTITDIKNFYNALAGQYDRMTSFETRFGADEKIFRSIIDRYKNKSALDAGAGTGFHSLLLSKLGITVTAVDVSKDMLVKLQENAQRLSLTVKIVESTFQQIDEKIDEKFDSVFCLGNSLVHILTDEELKKTLSNFHSLLNENGVLIIQILNYDRIMKDRERIQNIKEHNGTFFIRFYDFFGGRLFFNLLTISKEKDKYSHTLNTVELQPITMQELLSFMESSGFKNINTYGSLQFDNYDNKKSKDLVVVAEK